MTDMEIEILLREKEIDDCYKEEIRDDYLPRVRQHIGFCDERDDKRFVVKFHDIFYFTKTDGETKDLEQDVFDSLFQIFCDDMYETTQNLIETECKLTEREMMATHDIGHYSAFEYVIDKEITEENVVDVACEIYDAGLSPYYIDDYVKVVNHLKDMEDNYMEYWLDFLSCYEDYDNARKNIERRWKEYNEKYKK